MNTPNTPAKTAPCGLNTTRTCREESDTPQRPPHLCPRRSTKTLGNGTSRVRSNGSGGGAGPQEAILSARHDALRRITGGPAYARG